jgi:haloalkane dehalogenase
MHVRHTLTLHLHIGRLKGGNNQVPKLLFSVNPGMLLPPHRVKDVAEWMGNPPVVRLGNSGHFPQEEYPHRIGEETRRFVDNLLVGK